MFVSMPPTRYTLKCYHWSILFCTPLLLFLSYESSVLRYDHDMFLSSSLPTAAHGKNKSVVLVTPNSHCMPRPPPASLATAQSMCQQGEPPSAMQITVNSSSPCVFAHNLTEPRAQVAIMAAVSTRGVGTGDPGKLALFQVSGGNIPLSRIPNGGPHPHWPTNNRFCYPLFYGLWNVGTGTRLCWGTMPATRITMRKWAKHI